MDAFYIEWKSISQTVPSFVYNSSKLAASQHGQQSVQEGTFSGTIWIGATHSSPAFAAGGGIGRRQTIV